MGVVETSMHTSSLLYGSTARRRVSSVVSARFGPQGMVEENANAPAWIGQNASAAFELFNVGSGDGGRRAVQRYELFDHTLSVSTDVVVNRVAVKLYLG